MMLGLDRHLIIIKTFQNKLKSFNYQNNLFLNKEFLNEINKTKFKKFIISEENFIEFYKRKDVDGYTDFYNNKYNLLQKNNYRNNDLFVQPIDISDNNLPNGNSIYLLVCNS